MCRGLALLVRTVSRNHNVKTSLATRACHQSRIHSEVHQIYAPQRHSTRSSQPRWAAGLQLYTIQLIESLALVWQPPIRERGIV